MTQAQQMLRKSKEKIKEAAMVVGTFTAMAAAGTMAVSAIKDAGRSARDVGLKEIGIGVEHVTRESKRDDFNWPSLATREVGK